MADLQKLEQKANKLTMLNEAKGIRELAKNYGSALESIREDLRKLYDKYAKGGQLTYAEMSKFNRLRNLEKQITEDLRPVFLKNERLIDKVSAVSYEESFYRHTWAISQAAGFDLKFGLLRPDDVWAAIKNPLAKIAKDRLKRDGLDKIRRAITQGLIRGESYSQMSKLVRQAIDGSLQDAERIVRTESGRAMTLGTKKSYETARRNGVESVEVWDATLDGRTRPEHGRLDGQKAVRRKGEWVFQTAVGPVKGPRLSGVASFDINCRCTLYSVIEGYEPEARRIRGEGVQPYKTFKQWVEKKGITANRFGQKYDFTK